MACPQLNELLDYSRQLLPVQESAIVAAHLQSICPACEANLQRLNQIATVAAQDRGVDFAEEHVQGLVAWFKAQPALPKTGLRQLVARLLFDSLRPEELIPVRAEFGAMRTQAASAGRQMLFQADGYDIDLRFEMHDEPNSENLIGQVLAQANHLHDLSELSAATITMVYRQEQNMSWATAADSQGVFRFPRIPSGIYDVKIRLANEEIVLANVPTASAY